MFRRRWCLQSTRIKIGTTERSTGMFECADAKTKRFPLKHEFLFFQFQIYDETNILQDGTLIDLCGATLLWRSAEGLQNSPVSLEVRTNFRPNWFLISNALFADKTRFGKTCWSNKRRTATVSSWIEHIGDTAQNHIEWTHESALCLFKLWPCSRYPRRFHFDANRNCAFVHISVVFYGIFRTGNHDWGQDRLTGARRCPMCLLVGPVVTLCMGCEPAFYVDSGPPTYAFNPCGHMATEKTVKYVSIEHLLFCRVWVFWLDYISYCRYWANVDIPHGTIGFQAVCPFCATPLLEHPGYIKLIFQDNLD